MLNRVRWRLWYIRDWLWALIHRQERLDYWTWEMEQSYLEWCERESQMDNEPDPGWLCYCGHWQDDWLHCACCGNEPPQGCDCPECEDIYLRSFEDNDDWLWYWEHYPGELLVDNVDFGSDPECAEGADERD